MYFKEGLSDTLFLTLQAERLRQQTQREALKITAMAGIVAEPHSPQRQVVLLVPEFIYAMIRATLPIQAQEQKVFMRLAFSLKQAPSQPPTSPQPPQR
jgi:hypothetical protein